MRAFDPEFHFVMRWLHISFGSVWLGCLALFAFIIFGWVRSDPQPSLASVRNLVQGLLSILALVAVCAYTFGFTLLTDLSHVIGRRMFTVSWGLFILLAGYLGTQLLVLTLGFVIMPMRKVLFLESQTADLLAHRKWQRAEIVCQWAIIAAVPFLFFMIAAKHWVVVFDKAKQPLLYALFFAMGSLPFIAGLCLPKRLPRWSILLIGCALLAALLLTALWGRATV